MNGLRCVVLLLLAALLDACQLVTPHPVAPPKAAPTPKNLVESEPDIKNFRPAVRLKLPATRPAEQGMAERDAPRGFSPLVRIALTDARPADKASAHAAAVTGASRER